MINAPQAFTDETLELLGILETLLVDLEKSPGHEDLVQEMFRVMHTIKGAASMFGLHDIATFTHKIENVFDLVRKRRLEATRQLIGLPWRPAIKSS